MPVGPRERFRDGAAILPTYSFTINHAEEEPLEQARNPTRQALTTGPKFVIQQGDASPQVLRYTGTILTQEQLNMMQAYYLACESRSVFFRDVNGTEYEVLITRFSPERKRTLRNPREPSLLWYWSYSIEMEILP